MAELFARFWTWIVGLFRPALRVAPIVNACPRPAAACPYLGSMYRAPLPAFRPDRYDASATYARCRVCLATDEATS